MEAHLVHADKDGNPAVRALMFELGQETKALAKTGSRMPESASAKNARPPATDAPPRRS